MLTKHLQSTQQRLEELLPIDHIRCNHHIRRLPLLRQLTSLCHAPCELMGNGCATCCVYGALIEPNVAPDEILLASIQLLSSLSHLCR